MRMDELAALLGRSASTGTARLVEALFPGLDARHVAEEIVGAVDRWAAPVADVVFVRPGVGLVVGLELVDGRRVVLKLHRWKTSEQRLSAIQQVQSTVRAAGLPAPEPLVPPRPLGRGLATIEGLVAGARPDGHDPEVRAVMACGLADLLAATEGMAPPVGLGESHLRPDPDGPLWGEPHDLRFDFDATASGAEWIDGAAVRAKAILLDAALTDTIAHLDWRVENVAFAGGGIVAIYDWDSAALAPEAVAVGQAAAQFSTDWAIGFATLPTVEEMRSFVRSYESRRGRRFDPIEWEVLDAANLLLCAYCARCEHSDRTLRPSAVDAPERSWITLLHQRIEEAL